MLGAAVVRKPLQVAPEPRWVMSIVSHDQAGQILPGAWGCASGPQLNGDNIISNKASTAPTEYVTLWGFSQKISNILILLPPLRACLSPLSQIGENSVESKSRLTAPGYPLLCHIPAPPTPRVGDPEWSGSNDLKHQHSWEQLQELIRITQWYFSQRRDQPPGHWVNCYHGATSALPCDTSLNMGAGEKEFRRYLCSGWHQPQWGSAAVKHSKQDLCLLQFATPILLT